MTIIDPVHREQSVPTPRLVEALVSTPLPGGLPAQAAGQDAWVAPRPSVPHRERTPWWGNRYADSLLLVDLLAISWAAVGVHLIQLGAWSSAIAHDPVNRQFIAMTLVLSAAWMVVLGLCGSRDPHVVGHGPTEYKRMLNGSFALFGSVAVASYLFQWELPRGYLVIMLPCGLIALVLGRFMSRRRLHGRRQHGELMADVIAVGTVRTVQDLVDDLHRSTAAGYRVVGACIDTYSSAEFAADGFARVAGVPVLGRLEDAAEVAATAGAHVVVVTATDTFGPVAVRKLGWELEKTDTALVLAPALTNMAGPRIRTQPVSGLPLIHVEKPRYEGANRILKKTFDIVGAGLLVLLFSPFLLAAGLAVALTSPGGAFFRQERIGLNGRTFRMIKFRSMVADAEQRRAAMAEEERAAGNSVNAVMFKDKNDSRITKVGKVLRRLSIDELPQLFNVLRGEMSLVGPRPPLAAEVAKYGDDARVRLLVKPGMTGLWQVSGRSDLSWEETVRLDTYYVENWSITADLVILFKTARAVTSSSGAY